MAGHTNLVDTLTTSETAALAVALTVYACRQSTLMQSFNAGGIYKNRPTPTGIVNAGDVAGFNESP